MAEYKLLKHIDTLVLLCSTQLEFEMAKQHYIEHRLTEHTRILENAGSKNA